MGVNGRVKLFTPEFWTDPFPYFARLRAQDPVHTATLPPKTPIWLVTRYEDVQALLKESRFAKDRTIAMTPEQLRKMPWVPPMFRPLERNLIDRDPPDHTRLRALVHKAFTPRLVEQMRGRVQSLADELLDAAEAAGFDVFVTTDRNIRFQQNLAGSTDRCRRPREGTMEIDPAPAPGHCGGRGGSGWSGGDGRLSVYVTVAPVCAGSRPMPSPPAISVLVLALLTADGPILVRAALRTRHGGAIEAFDFSGAMAQRASIGWYGHVYSFSSVDAGKPRATYRPPLSGWNYIKSFQP